MDKKKKKIIVGLSGGIDSAVALALLKRNGYSTQAVFFRFLGKKNKKENQDLKNALEISKKLKIPLKIINSEKRFKKEITDNFLKIHEKGETPNPCVLCNHAMKFKILFQEMKKEKADCVATGHYALIKKNEIGGKNIFSLWQAKDKGKDQSYFLYKLNQRQLSRIVFPLGGYFKKETVKLAEKLKIPILRKKESQDACFLNGISLNSFLRKNLKTKKGKIINIKREKIGEHDGLPFYTIGQRKGINIGGRGPFYVFKKDRKNNNLIVVNRQEKNKLYSQTAEIKRINWIKKIFFPAEIYVKTRYRDFSVCATIRMSRGEKNCLLEFKKEQRAVTSGQSAVFYDFNGQVLGGGIIK